MALKTKTILTFLITLLVACEETIDLPLSSESLNLLVVEGMLTNEKLNHKIKIAHPYTTQNGMGVPVSGAVVRVTDGTSSVTLTEFPAESGEYYTPQVRAVFGKTYTLSIQFGGKTYFAQDSPVPVEPMEELTYRRVNELYTINFDKSGQSASFTDHQIDWTNTLSCIAGSACDGRVVFYDLKTIDVNDIFKPNKEEFDFPVNSTVIRKKYSVSPAYKAFLRSMLSETEWRGGVFDVQRANATTNLSEGAIGFFAVSTVVSDTTIVVEKP